MEENNEIEKFKTLLKELFRVDLQDLDFGIYKIMKIKQEMTIKFIENDLISIVNSVLNEIQKNEVDDLKNQVFNLTYEFFSRYYDHGDFIPQLRYGGRDKYMIPYNGQEVELYWATRNAYYVKTTEYFTNYSFMAFIPLDQANKWKVNFKIKEADLEKNYVKTEKKYFFLDENPIEILDKEANAFFNYRPMTEDEGNKFDVNENVIKDVLKKEEESDILAKVPVELKEMLSRDSEEKDKERTLLRRHLDIYFKKNESDYFINKDLKGFLDSELDNFIKNEIIQFDDKFEVPENRRYLAKAISSLCKETIDQISQIEDFEKKLWEKKKFAYDVDYVISLDRIARKDRGIDLIKKIIESKYFDKQVDEWKSLDLIDESFSKGKLIANDLDSYHLNEEYKFLPIDTKYFKDLELDILSLFDNLDNELDGQLIHSENYQALNTILPKFKENVQAIYIDPPFNKDQNADYLYNVKYKDSTWITLLENKISMAKSLLKLKSSFLVRCDYNGNMYVKLLMNAIFGKDNFRNEIAVRRFKKNVMDKEIKKLPEGLDTIYIYSNSDWFKYKNPFKLNDKEREGFWRHMGDSSGQGSPKTFFGKEMTPQKGKHWKFSQENIDEKIKLGELILECRSCGHIHDVNAGNWNSCSNCGRDDPIPKYWVNGKDDQVLDSDWSDIYGYSTKWKFPTENSESLLRRVIKSTSSEGDIIADFFLGSGTTTAVAHKLKRKWIGIEMGEHFHTLILPRMKKVLFYDKSAISKEEDVRKNYNENNAGGFFKYLDLEQYEDSLNNIKISDGTLDNNAKSHLLKYILRYGTSSSQIFINKEMLADPFNFRMQIVESGVEKEIKIDLLETFSLWYGISVEKILSFKADDRKYIFEKGRKNRQGLLVIWRDTTNLDYEKDRNFILNVLKEKFNIEDSKPEFDQVLVNSDVAFSLSDYNLKIRSLDPIFFELQWGDMIER